ncbi:hypothetical protein Plhal304r1_c007g0030211 [Plasmopara halstedii]
MRTLVKPVRSNALEVLDTADTGRLEHRLVDPDVKLPCDLTQCRFLTSMFEPLLALADTINGGNLATNGCMSSRIRPSSSDGTFPWNWASQSWRSL